VCVDYIAERPALIAAPRLIATPDELDDVIAKVTDAPRVSIAVRTTNHDGVCKRTRVCGIGFEDGSTAVVDLQATGKLVELGSALCIPKLVGVDLKDTLLALAPFLQREPSDVLDLTVVSRVLEAGDGNVNHDLASLRDRHLGTRRSSHSGELRWSGHLTRVHAVDVADGLADVLFLAEVMLEEAEFKDLMPVLELEAKVTPATIEMEARGLPINEQRWFETVGHLEARAVATRRLCLRAEPEQDQTTAERLKSELRSMESVLNGFVRATSQALRASPEPRVCGELQQCGTVTGRFTCEGVPLLSIPNGYNLRGSFEAPEAQVFVRADFSCFELRVLAALAGDEVLLALFARGDDAHRQIASELLQKPAELVSNEERERIKPVSFGTIFGLQPAGMITLAKEEYDIDLLLSEATAYRAAFFARFAGVAAWQEALLKERDAFSRTRLGRLRRWDNDSDRDGARLAFPVQGSAADVMKLCVSELYWELKALGAAILLVIHDEVIVECPATAAEAVRLLLETKMPAIAASMFPEVPFIVDAQIAKTLRDPDD
jgi:DNA polymerase I-like protein with 3'-5' exonuclease and polymerase domains